MLAGGLFKSSAFAARVQSLLDAPAQRLETSPVLGGISLAKRWQVPIVAPFIIFTYNNMT